MLPKPRLVQGPRYGGGRQASAQEVEEDGSAGAHEARGPHSRRGQASAGAGQRLNYSLRPLFPSFESPRDRSSVPTDVERIVWTTQTGLFQLTGKPEVFARAVLNFSHLQPTHAELCTKLVQALLRCHDPAVHLKVVRAGQAPGGLDARFIEVQVPELQGNTFVLPNAFTSYYRLTHRRS